jgi:hypothetical protein
MVNQKKQKPNEKGCFESAHHAGVSTSNAAMPIQIHPSHDLAKGNYD